MILETKTLARSMMRRARLTPVVHRLRMLWHRADYEDKFADLLLASIRPDDCVWDVGANVGFYTERFAKIARQVVAFEPVLENCRRIESRRMPNVDCLAIALGDAGREAPIFVDGPFSSLARPPYPGASSHRVKVARGDDLNLPPPTVIKIDVEGYEREVIQGMSRILEGVRALFVEIHFQILDQRGLRQAPSAIVRDLRQAGFSRIEWPDASHLAAFRAGQDHKTTAA